MTTTDEFIVATPRMAAGLLIRDTAGQVLLVKPTYKKGWDIPGGYVEPAESPAQACRREVLEELGLPLPVGRLLVVDWAPHPNEGDKILWIFDGGQLSSDQLTGTVLQTEEIAEHRFWPESMLDSLMPERLSKRLKAAANAQRHALTLYLESGVTVESQQD